MTIAIASNVMVEVLRQKAYTPVSAIAANVMVEVLRQKAYTPVSAIASNVMIEVLRVIQATQPPVQTGAASAQFLSF